MKTLLVVVLMSLATVTQADHWTKADTYRELVGQGLILVDWGQTLDISRSCNSDGEFYEKNSILGRCPSRGEVNRYFAASMLIHGGISYLLPTKGKLLGNEVNPRALWQYVTIGYQANTVYNNYRIGVRIDF